MFNNDSVCLPTEILFPLATKLEKKFLKFIQEKARIKKMFSCTTTAHLFAINTIKEKD